MQMCLLHSHDATSRHTQSAGTDTALLVYESEIHDLHKLMDAASTHSTHTTHTQNLHSQSEVTVQTAHTPQPRSHLFTPTQGWPAADSVVIVLVVIVSLLRWVEALGLLVVKHQTVRLAVDELLHCRVAQQLGSEVADLDGREPLAELVDGDAGVLGDAIGRQLLRMLVEHRTKRLAHHQLSLVLPFALLDLSLALGVVVVVILVHPAILVTPCRPAGLLLLLLPLAAALLFPEPCGLALVELHESADEVLLLALLADAPLLTRRLQLAVRQPRPVGVGEHLHGQGGRRRAAGGRAVLGLVLR
mmetsp:Transcript_32257/g.79900  ORF Transcript_32257/g.79900 Transcript_32257/m.79900 type:complete len:303 (+) Transcript_32257:104-1012(+)